MHVRLVDERQASGEVDHPVFRVFLWSRPPIPPSVEPWRIGWSCDTYELTGCDVQDALNWAFKHIANDGTYTLYVCHLEEDGNMFMTRLAGTDPTRQNDVHLSGE